MTPAITKAIAAFYARDLDILSLEELTDALGPVLEAARDAALQEAEDIGDHCSPHIVNDGDGYFDTMGCDCGTRVRRLRGIE